MGKVALLQLVSVSRPVDSVAGVPIVISESSNSIPQSEPAPPLDSFFGLLSVLFLICPMPVISNSHLLQGRRDNDFESTLRYRTQ